MPFDLKGRNVLVTGGSRGLGAVICEKFAAEGSNVSINFAASEAPARELQARLKELYPHVTVLVVRADCGDMVDCARCVEETVEGLGGLDVIVGNAGWTRFSKFGDLHDMSEAEWDKCWAVNVKGQMALLRAALPTFNANADGGAFILTSSVAGVTTSGSSMPYSVAKAAGLQLIKCLAMTQGPKVRVNAVLPGLLLTEWGLKYGDRIKDLENSAALKTVTDLEDCANAFVYLAKNTSMTGMKVQVDAGLVINSP